MKTSFSVVVFAVASLFVPSAAAVCFDVNAQGTFVGLYSGNDPGPGGEIDGCLFLYRDNQGGAEEGSAAAQALFETAYSTDLLTATITVAPGGPQPALCYLVLKAASEYALWNISSWNDAPYDCLTVENTKITNKAGELQAISHVSLYTGYDRIPDGGSTLLMLGSALTLLGGVARRKLA